MLYTLKTVLTHPQLILEKIVAETKNRGLKPEDVFVNIDITYCTREDKEATTVKAIEYVEVCSNNQ
jgi:hypothetical protein